MICLARADRLTDDRGIEWEFGVSRSSNSSSTTSVSTEKWRWGGGIIVENLPSAYVFCLGGHIYMVLLLLFHSILYPSNLVVCMCMCVCVCVCVCALKNKDKYNNNNYHL